MIRAPHYISIALVSIGSLIPTLSGTSQPHFIWNLTPSVPRGLYSLQPPSHLRVPTLVVAVPPEPLASVLADGGYLPRGVPLLKRVLALPGQVVCRIGAQISVDGVPAATTAQERDGRGQPLPVWHGCRIIAADEIFLMNFEAPDSLDGRYFGPLPRSAVIAHAMPLWTDEAGDGRFIWRAPTQ